MNCLIDNTINRYAAKGKRAEAIRRYIRMKYRINIDLEAIKKRLKNLSPTNVELA